MPFLDLNPYDNTAQNIVYTPPSDWIDITTGIPDGAINLLVNDTTLATYAFQVATDAGQYQVDWGDTTVTLYDSETIAQHTYTVGTGELCSRGYTTFKIEITPTTGNNITSFMTVAHSLANGVQELGILAIVCNSDTVSVFVPNPGGAD